MLPQPETIQPPPTADAGLVDIIVARQPIFDASDRLMAYELLYRHDASAERAEGISTSAMSADVIVKAVLGVGVREITGGVRGYLNFAEEQLTDDIWRLCAPDEIAIELLETVARTPRVVEACSRLVAAGYQLVLDDFRWDESYVPLLELRPAPIVKVDVRAHEPAELEALVKRLRRYGVQLLAECVEDRETKGRCQEIGFTLFQGYYFARPEVYTRKEPPVAQLTILRLLNLLRDMDVSDAELDEAFSADPPLCYKLLRLVNNAATGRSGIESVQHAIRMVGRGTVHRWLSLLLASSLVGASGTAGELALTAMTRGRFAELLLTRGRTMRDHGGAFIVGLFSLIDVMMHMQMADVLGQIDLAPEVRQALLERRGPLAEPLSLGEAVERMDFEGMLTLSQRLQVPMHELGPMYVESMRWARERLLITIA